jgi:hypothetical protein
VKEEVFSAGRPMKKEPKSVAEWAHARRKHKGAFMVYRDLYTSPACEQLKKNPKYLLALLEALFQLDYEKRGANQNRKVYRNGGIICLPQNRLKLAGISSTDTQAKAKERLVELGFLDVLESGALFAATKFQISDRWRKYPNVPPQKDPKPIARRMYAEHSLSNPDHAVHRKRNKKKISHSIIECSNAPIIECSAEDVHSMTECSEPLISGSSPFDDRMLFKSFHGTPSQRGSKHQGATQQHEREESQNSIDQKVLEKPIPAQITAILERHGRCAVAARQIGKDVELRFDDGCTIHARTTEYEYFAGTDGEAGIVFKDIAELETLLPILAREGTNEEARSH